MDIEMKGAKSTPLAKANRHFQLKEYDKAISLYRAEIDGGEVLDLYAQNLVLALKKSGFVSEASKELYKALAKNPKSKVLNSILSHDNQCHIDRHQGPMLSVIVPVYNSGKYLEQCLRSILNQSFSDLELIVVNDGSTDNSKEIIESLATEDSRVRLLVNEVPSGNPGTPRNQALSIASGAYIGFVDSDDWIEPDFYSTLMGRAVKELSDIVFSCGFHNRREDGSDTREYGPSEFNNAESVGHKYHESFMVWDKVFSAKLIKSFDVRLGETKAAVDVPFIFKAYYYAQRVSFCDGYIGYNYRRESESSVTVNYRKSSDCNFEIVAYQSVEKWAEDEGVSNIYRNIISYKKVSSFIYTLSVIAPKMFDKFYETVKLYFKEVDQSVVESFCRHNGKRHVLKKYDFVLANTAADYRKEYRLDSAGPSVASKKVVVPIEERNTFGLSGESKGVVFFPDWSKRNPYQKLLYASLAKQYGVRVKGYAEKLFCSELLEKNADDFGVVHLHWLHVFMDFSRPDGADEFIRNLEVAKSLGYKILYTAHNIISHDSKYKEREREFRKRAAQYFDRIFVHGELAKKRIVSEVGVSPEKVYTVPHGSYEGYYPNYVNAKISRKRFDIEEEDFVFLFFGNIKGYKGVDELINSYERVSRLYNNTKLIIAGRVFEDETGQLIESYVAKDDSIIFHPGFIEESDAQYYFNAADIVVLPYRRILTSGAALLSFSYHKPIIAPRSGLLPEIMEEGEQGHFFDSYEEMLGVMQSLVEEKQKGIVKRYTFEAVNKKLRWSTIVQGGAFSGVFGVVEDGRQGENGEEKPHNYALLRILGNDLPFRHNENQTLTNLEFTLKNERDFEGCVKIWVLNRIIDRSKKVAIQSLLDKYGKEYIDIPYHGPDLAKVPFCFEDLPVDEFKLTPEFDKLSDRNKIIVDTAILKHKNNYLMNNNGARNTALTEGAKRARWVFPWDGNCFLNDQAWEAIKTSLKARDDVQYHIVPMDRVMSNEAVIGAEYAPNPVEEPQIVFRADAELSFDENLMYGLKPKVDLLKRLGVPGIWDKWNNLYPWRKHEIRHDRNSFNYVWSGWVARLFSGNESQELSAHDRALNRERGIVEFITSHDKKERFSGFDKNRLAYYNEELLQKLKDNPSAAKDLGLESALKTIRSHAEEYLPNPVYSVVNKTTLPPSGDRKDYWHPAPYAWPNPDTEDGLPYIHKDGERVPGTRMYEPESVKYDRTSVQRLFDETTALALAGYLFDNSVYMEKSYRLIHTWFINPETAMNPNLSYSQVVMGKNDNKGTASGLIETKDFYFLLDAVRLVKRTPLWTVEDEAVMNKWCENFVNWLCTSEQGLKEERAKNNHGNAYDLQVYAFLSYLGDTDRMYEVTIRALSRLKSHVEPDGKQPHELRRTTTAHYTSFNLHLWISLHALIQSTSGISLIDEGQHYGFHKNRSALKLASSWVLRHGLLPEWPFKQIDHFDKARYEHIYHSISLFSPSLESKYSGRFEDISVAKDVYFPHDGVAPYWKLALRM